MENISDNVDRRSFIKRSATSTAAFFALPYVIGGCTSDDNNNDLASEDEFTPLFDGESLEGWHTNREPIGHGDGGRWTVENGAIVGQQDPPGSGNGGILLTDETFDDFELLLDVDPDWGPDSGVFLRSTPTGECYQVYVDYHDDAIIGFIYGEGLGGWRTEPFRYDGVLDDGELVDLSMKSFEHFEGYRDHLPEYYCTPNEWREAWEINEYNTIRIRCVGEYPTITTWINGTRICKWDASKNENPEFDREEALDVLGRDGHIALQVHGGSDWWPAGSKIRWKNIKVREI